MQAPRQRQPAVKPWRAPAARRLVVVERLPRTANLPAERRRGPAEALAPRGRSRASSLLQPEEVRQLELERAPQKARRAMVSPRSPVRRLGVETRSRSARDRG